MQGLILTDEFKNLSKGDIKALAKDYVQQLADGGDINPLELFVKIKRFELLVEETINNLKPLAMKEADKHGNSFNFIGAKCNVKSGSTILDYEKDEVYLSLKNDLKKRKELLDLAFKMKETIVDEFGNDVPKVPVKTYCETVLSITL